MTSPEFELHDCALSDLGSLEYSFARGLLPESRIPTLVVRLVGSTSNTPNQIGVFSHASAIIMAGLEAWEPWAVTLDLEHLEYTWGKWMTNILSAPQRWYEPHHHRGADRRIPSR